VRTCVVRRRFDQRIQEAIEAGVLDPDQVETYRRGGGEIGERPEMWEVTVVKVDKKEMEDVDLESVEVESKEVVSNWAGTMVGTRTREYHVGMLTVANIPQPVSASIVATHANPHSLPFQQLPINITGPQLFSPSACAHEEYPLPPTSFSNTASPSTSNASVPQLSESQLQVAFLIALPTPRTKSNTDASNGQEEPVPQVALGVTEIPWCSKEQWIADDEGVGDAMRTQVAGGYMHGV
jgi:hypothetical protein